MNRRIIHFLQTEYAQRQDKIREKVAAMQEAIGEYLSAEMADLGAWFTAEYARHIPQVHPSQVPLVSLWADVEGNKYVVYQRDRLYWEGNPATHIGWMRPMIFALMELEESLAKEVAKLEGRP